MNNPVTSFGISFIESPFPAKDGIFNNGEEL
jgi:hypothetical protein